MAAALQGLGAKGVAVLKFLFNPLDSTGADTPVAWRPMLTFGKREARAHIARQEGLTPESLPGPGVNDLKSYYSGIHANRKFTELNGKLLKPYIHVATVDLLKNDLASESLRIQWPSHRVLA